MAQVLMVEVERDNIAAGMDFFCNMFDGENPLSPCGIPYLFLTLYQNSLSDGERAKIIEDINHHVGDVQLIRLYGLKNIDGYVTLKQNVKVQLQKLLLNLRAPQTSTRLFNQVEKETDLESILCSFDSVMYDTVMGNLQNISRFIQQCVQEIDLPSIFVNQDYSILAPPKAISSKKGFFTSKTIPLEIQEHTSFTLSKMSKVEKRQFSPDSSTSPSISSFSTSTAPSTFQSKSYTSAAIAAVHSPTSSEIDRHFQAMETKINDSHSRMDSIEDLCRQLKSNTDIISQNIQQLAMDFYSSRQHSSENRSPVTKAQRLSES